MAYRKGQYKNAAYSYEEACNYLTMYKDALTGEMKIKPADTSGKPYKNAAYSYEEACNYLTMYKDALTGEMKIKPADTSGKPKRPKGLISAGIRV